VQRQSLVAQPTGGTPRGRGRLAAGGFLPQRGKRQGDVMEFFIGVADLLESSGIPCRIRSAGCVATSRVDCRGGEEVLDPPAQHARVNMDD
jgi:hypothetical protein